MPTFTKAELRAMNAHGWEPEDYCPLHLRDVRKVLADAAPEYLPAAGVYRWHPAGGDWWGVCPPAGVLPLELIRAMGRQEFPTRAEAVQALRAAAAKLDSRPMPCPLFPLGTPPANGAN